MSDYGFTGATLVDGIPIRDIKEGQFVMSYNFKLGKLKMRRVLKKFVEPMPSEMIKINNNLVVTFDHPFYELGNGKYIPARLLRLGHKLFTRTNSIEVIERLELIRTKGEDFVYSLKVEELHNYFANGYLVFHTGV